MRLHVRLFSALSALSLAVWLVMPALCAAEGPQDKEKLRTVVEAVKVPVNDDLRMKDLKKGSAYYGIIRSADELDELWSKLINIKKPYKSRFGFGIPDPPKIDFEKNSLIWFADEGAGASFVDSILVAAYDSDRTLFVTFVASHSDSGSERLNLWTVPIKGYTAKFSVLHKYEEKGR